MTKALLLLLGCLVIVLVASSSAKASSCSGSANYQIKLTGLWNIRDKKNFPGSPSGSHFSPSAIVAHNSDVSFWEPGTKATPGLTLLAERGDPSVLLQEIRTVSQVNPSAVKEDTIARFFDSLDPKGTFTYTIEFDQDHPLVTFATMLGPTPDWFTGLSGYSLCDEQNGTWLRKSTLILGTWDAGTRSSNVYAIGGPSEDKTIRSREKKLPTRGPVMRVQFRRIDA
eukprot:TRINITY_DN11777_c0_g1_i1.p1 TRINITY_DN11777_c0_g1~~TRINITY_DN11777_c0_g1_i1.p1  ORF type:complete len:226 (+),score=54.00 TRINITY_DN11777_c0_g1_i1:256-933(+)